MLIANKIPRYATLEGALTCVILHNNIIVAYMALQYVKDIPWAKSCKKKNIFPFFSEKYVFFQCFFFTKNTFHVFLQPKANMILFQLHIYQKLKTRIFNGPKYLCSIINSSKIFFSNYS